MLYIEPTQTVWDGIRNTALALIPDADVYNTVSKVIDARTNQFLAGTNGDVNKVRKNIWLYLLGTNMSAESIDLLAQIGNSNLDNVRKKILAAMLGAGTEPAKIRMLLNN